MNLGKPVTVQCVKTRSTYLLFLVNETVTISMWSGGGASFTEFRLGIVCIFTARRSYASTVLGVVILSVRLSICHTCALWLIQRTYRRYFIAHERANFAALNRGRHVCSAGRPSRWALAYILVVSVLLCDFSKNGIPRIRFRCIS